MEPKPNDGKRPPPPNPWGALSSGFQLVVSVLLGVFFGGWLDGRCGTSPWFLLLGASGGIVLGIYTLIRDSSRKG